MRTNILAKTLCLLLVCWQLLVGGSLVQTYEAESGDYAMVAPMKICPPVTD